MSDKLIVKEVQENQIQSTNEIKHICDIIDQSLARDGYKVVDGGEDWIIIRNLRKDIDFEINLVEFQQAKFSLS